MYQCVLLPIDVNEESSWRKALPEAIGHCQASGAELHLLTVVPDYGMPQVVQYFPEGYVEKALEDCRKRLEHLAAETVPPEIKVTASLSHGIIYQEILKAARAHQCDLIVMASHRPQLQDYLLGPNAARVVRHAECSVLVVRE
ncbi:MAG: universal stress protein [Kiloniellaceae bacterium]